MPLVSPDIEASVTDLANWLRKKPEGKYVRLLTVVAIGDDNHSDISDTNRLSLFKARNRHRQLVRGGHDQAQYLWEGSTLSLFGISFGLGLFTNEGVLVERPDFEDLLSNTPQTQYRILHHERSNLEAKRRTAVVLFPILQEAFPDIGIVYTNSDDPLEDMQIFNYQG
ncbi:hypothetical protein HY087_00405 [Candidatus Gottesmanbacteria bacterium]|nr:hypothetical protein [Candidatus Gottesmanbacteria bacterium]MBI3559574.1 hypothetical protein [Candidatus Gottesmanbacteria bacterium]